MERVFKPVFLGFLESFGEGCEKEENSENSEDGKGCEKEEDHFKVLG